MRDVIAVVLARAGSKGVPGKNAAMVAGRPCVAWTIEHARQSASVARIVVSSDCPRVIEVARGMGGRAADVALVQRPAGLAADAARVDEAAAHAIETIERECGAMDDATPVAILYGNVPVRPAGLLDRAAERMRVSGADSVQSYEPVGKRHPWWTARLDGEGVVRPWEGEVLNHGVHRRQDLPPAYVPDGGVLIVRRGLLRAEVFAGGPHAFFGSRRAGVVNEAGAVVDIDAPIDLIVADEVLRQTVGGVMGTVVGGVMGGTTSAGEGAAA